MKGQREGVKMQNVYQINYALQRANLIENRAAVINDSLNRGYPAHSPATVTYPRGRGYGEFSICGHTLYRWRRYDLDAIERALENVDSIKRAVFILSGSGHMYWF